MVDSVQWIERLLDAGVRTLQATHQKIFGAMKRWKPMSWRQLRWAAAITRDCLSTILLAARNQPSGVSRPFGAEITSHQSQCHPRGRPAAGRSTHDDMEIDVALAARPSYIALGHVFPTQTERCLLHRRGWNSWHGMFNAWRIIPVAIGGISLARAPAVIATGVGSIAVVSAITQAAD
ncbi:thiamine phosphate synthase [Shigella flexneri]